MGDIMKNHQCIGAFLAATVVLGSLGLSEANAQSRTFFAPWVTYYPPGPPITTPTAAMTYQYYPTAPAYYSTYSMYNPYVAPYPAYGILPPPFLTERYGWDLSGTDPRARRIAETYGYARGSFDVEDRKRASLAPAVPYQPVKEEAVGDGRRVRFEITVPSPNAIVTIDGAKTRQTGIAREYITPALELDRLFTSTIVVEWRDEVGQKQTRSKSFDFIAGETVRFTFRE
jgi:uncharacterized protein (TIGR03000 family)